MVRKYGYIENIMKYKIRFRRHPGNFPTKMWKLNPHESGIAEQSMERFWSAIQSISRLVSRASPVSQLTCAITYIAIDMCKNMWRKIMFISTQNVKIQDPEKLQDPGITCGDKLDRRGDVGAQQLPGNLKPSFAICKRLGPLFQRIYDLWW